MRMVSYDDFLNEVLPYVIDCPDTVAVNAIKNACIEFCELSHWLRHTTEPMDVEAGESEYKLGCGQNMTVEMVLSATYGRRPLKAMTPDQLASRYGADWRRLEGEPRGFVQVAPDTVILTPTPNKTVESVWVAELCLKPTRKSTHVSASIHEHWAEIIGFGARARLYETPNQPYSDPAEGLRYRARFRAACREVRTKTHAGVGRAELRARMRTFGV